MKSIFNYFSQMLSFDNLPSISWPLWACIGRQTVSACSRFSHRSYKNSVSEKNHFPLPLFSIPVSNISRLNFSTHIPFPQKSRENPFPFPSRIFPVPFPLPGLDVKALRVLAEIGDEVADFSFLGLFRRPACSKRSIYSTPADDQQTKLRYQI